MGVKWNLMVVLMCISLMTNDVEHLFTCSLAIYVSSLEKCLFKSYARFYFFLIFIYLFILAALDLSCGTRDLLAVA